MDKIFMSTVNGRNIKTIRNIEIDSHMGLEYYDEYFENIKQDGERGYSLIHINNPCTIDGEYYNAITSVEGIGITCATTCIDDDGFFGTWTTSFPVSKGSKHGKIVLEYRDKSYVFEITTDHNQKHYIMIADEKSMKLLLDEFNKVVDVIEMEMVYSFCAKSTVDGVTYKQYAHKYPKQGVIELKKRYLIKTFEGIKEEYPVLKILGNVALVESRTTIDIDVYNLIKNEL